LIRALKTNTFVFSNTL
jgi:4-hydroxy-3-methylbut-2-enyl diphosphate reductase